MKYWPFLKTLWSLFWSNNQAVSKNLRWPRLLFLSRKTHTNVTRRILIGLSWHHNIIVYYCHVCQQLIIGTYRCQQPTRQTLSSFPTVSNRTQHIDKVIRRHILREPLESSRTILVSKWNEDNVYLFFCFRFGKEIVLAPRSRCR